MYYKKVEAYCKKTTLLFLSLKRSADGNGTISGWVDSKPRIDSLQKVAAMMGITLAELLKDD